MRYQFEFRPYRRPFKHPLTTPHGTWEVREGIIVRLTDDRGKVGYGEIAPVPWFGSETLADASSFCEQLGREIGPEIIFSIPPRLTACQFAIESAWEIVSTQPSAIAVQPELGFEAVPYHHLTYSGLLPAGAGAAIARQILWKQGYRTFKWKIGVAPIEAELKSFQQLVRSLRDSFLQETALLRLDANGALTYDQACRWLETCERLGEIEHLPLKIEFLEQPLAVGDLDEMLQLADRFAIPLALDESVAGLSQLRQVYREGWRGIFVIKPCIAGSPSELRQFCQTQEIDAVFSSVFETQVGRQAALKIAAELQNPGGRAVGFGVTHWFEDGEEVSIDRLWTDL
ncbi:o-succinylbenzoate synthase [Oxynema sp. CENA135]|uniref:o-succinylbenzoate synthase n=1 Tax=Oxynema sp. CENA135 TaxID=984206 RepID=UPI00190E067F|nr:o-succinylbenzoate synthase [Oxynema sp. CENA135]MBK4729915.1 o-succinylbenzoate synthase [Oxynema sp. CENA135]